MGGFLVNAGGSHLRRIPTDAYVEYPAWSPHGGRIAFMGGASAAEYGSGALFPDWIPSINGRMIAVDTWWPTVRTILSVETPTHADLRIRLDVAAGWDRPVES